MILMESTINIWNVSMGIGVIQSRLRNKKFLIVLDDVDEKEQLEAQCIEELFVVILVNPSESLVNVVGYGCMRISLMY